MRSSTRRRFSDSLHSSRMEEIGILNDGNDYAEVDEKDIWNDVVEQYLIDLMVHEVKKGNRTTSTFSKSGWRAIQEGLKTKFLKEYTPVQLKNKYNSLRSRQRNFKALLKEPGIYYDSLTGMVDATHECWKNIFKVHKTAKRFRRKGCKEYGDLCFIFGEVVAISSYAHPYPESPSYNEREVKVESEVGGESGSGNTSTHSSHTHADANKLKNKALVEFPNPKKIKRTCSSIFEKATTPKNDGYEASLPERDEFTVVMECLRVLHDLGIHGNAYGKAVKAFHDSPLYRKIFLSMPDERKIDWVNVL